MEKIKIEPMKRRTTKPEDFLEGWGSVFIPQDVWDRRMPEVSCSWEKMTPEQIEKIPHLTWEDIERLGLTEFARKPTSDSS
jgi:hypothetical protein